MARETGEDVEVKYYELADIKPDVAQQTGDWMEAWLLGDEETAEAIRREAADALRPLLFREGRWYADYVRLRGKAYRP